MGCNHSSPKPQCWDIFFYEGSGEGSVPHGQQKTRTFSERVADSEITLGGKYNAVLVMENASTCKYAKNIHCTYRI